jgi:hypothetical protein
LHAFIIVIVIAIVIVIREKRTEGGRYASYASRRNVFPKLFGVLLCLNRLDQGSCVFVCLIVCVFSYDAIFDSLFFGPGSV